MSLDVDESRLSILLRGLTTESNISHILKLKDEHFYHQSHYCSICYPYSTVAK